jgi:hypothetical protein
VASSAWIGTAPGRSSRSLRHDDQLAGAHRRLGLGAQGRDAVLQRLALRPVQVEQRVAALGFVLREQLAELALRQHRGIDDDAPGVLRPRLEQVVLAPDLRLQRHHHALAQRVDRRVRDLRELLPEIVVQRADAARHERQRRIVAHRADGLGLALAQRPQHFLALLAGDAEHLFVARQLLARHRLREQLRIDQRVSR